MLQQREDSSIWDTAAATGSTADLAAIKQGGVMHIDEPCCGFLSCSYYFDGNCTSKIKYESCEYMHLRFFLHELQEKLGDNEELKKAIDVELYGQG